MKENTHRFPSHGRLSATRPTRQDRYSPCPRRLAAIRPDGSIGAARSGGVSLGSKAGSADLRNGGFYFTYLANAALFIDCGARLLADALYDPSSVPFSPLPAGLLEREALRADRLLFTHEHPDHFTPSCAWAYLQKYGADKIFLPPPDSPESKKLGQALGARACYPSPHENYHLPGGAVLSCFYTSHMGAKYQGYPNLCYLLEYAGKTLLITGDADPSAPPFAHALSGKHVDAAFVNPLFFCHKAGRDLLTTIIRPKTIYVYHIPFPEDRPEHYLRLFDRARPLYAGLEGEIVPLLSSLTTYSLLP